MYENWLLKKWDTPFSDAASLRMKSLSDCDGRLEIILQDVAEERTGYRIIFERYPAYRNIMEEYRLELWNKLDKEGMAGRSSLIADPSPWVTDLMKEPLLELHYPKLRHYIVATEDDVVEVLTDKEPSIEVLGPIDRSEPIPGKSLIYFKKGDPIH